MNRLWQWLNSLGKNAGTTNPSLVELVKGKPESTTVPKDNLPEGYSYRVRILNEGQTFEAVQVLIVRDRDAKTLAKAEVYINVYKSKAHKMARDEAYDVFKAKQEMGLV